MANLTANLSIFYFKREEMVDWWDGEMVDCVRENKMKMVNDCEMVDCDMVDDVIILMRIKYLSHNHQPSSHQPTCRWK